MVPEPTRTNRLLGSWYQSTQRCQWLVEWWAASCSREEAESRPLLHLQVRAPDNQLILSIYAKPVIPYTSILKFEDRETELQPGEKLTTIALVSRLWPPRQRPPCTEIMAGSNAPSHGPPSDFPAGCSILYGESLMKRSGLQENDFTAHR